MYEEGRGVPRDDQLAVQWYRKAAEQGHAAGQNNLGWMYAEGRGVPKDDRLAVQWFRKAAKQGHAAAHSNLYLRYPEVSFAERLKTEAEQGDAQAPGVLPRFHGHFKEAR